MTAVQEAPADGGRSTGMPVTVTPVSPGRLEHILGQTAERIAESGTGPETATLYALAHATGHLAPGATAALVDWAGSEVARQRAFGIVHGVALHDLDGDGRSRLLDRLTGE